MGTLNDGPGAPGSCAEARVAMGAGLGAGKARAGDHERHQRMREHLEDCEECHEAYQTMAGGVASIRGLQQRQREIEARRRNSTGVPGLGALAAYFALHRQRPSNRVKRLIWQLRPLVLVAFFIFLIREVSGPPKPRAGFGIIEVEGAVWLGGEPLGGDPIGFEGLALRRGAELITGPGGRVSIGFEEARFAIGPESGFLIERAFARRVRLARGEVFCEGRFDLGVGPLMLHSDGEVSLGLKLVGDELAFELTGGAVDVATPLLNERFEAPLSLRFDRFGSRLP